jgi:hypothetical protein
VASIALAAQSATKASADIYNFKGVQPLFQRLGKAQNVDDSLKVLGSTAETLLGIEGIRKYCLKKG